MIQKIHSLTNSKSGIRISFRDRNPCHHHKLDNGPFPAPGFPTDNRQSTHALHRKYIKDQQRPGGGRIVNHLPGLRIPVPGHMRSDGRHIGIIFNAVNRRHGADKTSLAANEHISAIPIFQSNPSGAIAGSMVLPRIPAKDFSRAGFC